MTDEGDIAAAPVFPARRRRRALVQGALVVSDTIALCSAGLLATYLRFGIWRHVAALPELGSRVTFARLSIVVAAIWIVGLWFERLYDLDRVFWGTGEYTRVAKGLSFGLVVFILATYVLKLPGLSRGWTLLAWGLALILTVTGRSLVRWGLASARRRGMMLRPTLVVGFNAEAADIIRALRKDTTSGLVPVGCLADLGEVLDAAACGGEVPCLGEADDIRRVLGQRYIDTVIIASTSFPHHVLSRVVNDLRGYDVDIQLSSGLLDVTTRRVQVREVSGFPLITVRSVSFSLWKRTVKRVFDLVLGTVLIVVGLPAWLVLAAAIKFGSRGPVLYRQLRVGRGGEPFHMLKFRSMCSDADARREELVALNEASGPLFKMKDDPRVTPIGRWMRKYSIDEFPQLLNVIRGEMSLVGPRPPLPDETKKYADLHWRRMEVLPGMTGLWQVSGRSKLTFEEMVRLDLFYIENWSVTFDLGLLVRTIPAVLFARGAY